MTSDKHRLWAWTKPGMGSATDTVVDRSKHDERWCCGVEMTKARPDTWPPVGDNCPLGDGTTVHALFVLSTVWWSLLLEVHLLSTPLHETATATWHCSSRWMVRCRRLGLPLNQSQRAAHTAAGQKDRLMDNPRVQQKTSQKRKGADPQAVKPGKFSRGQGGNRRTTIIPQSEFGPTPTNCSSFPSSPEHHP
jgi:hypothetical protein